MREAMAEQEWVNVMQLWPVFGPHSRLVFEYVEKFSIHPMKIKVKKLLRLLTDIAGLFKTGRFVINRAEYEVSQRGIVEALTIVNNRNFEQALENHNYLKKVLAGISEKECTETRAKLDAEQRRKQVSHRRTQTRADDSPPHPDPLPPGEREIGQEEDTHGQRTTVNGEQVLSAEENAKRARELVEKIGTRT